MSGIVVGTWGTHNGVPTHLPSFNAGVIEGSVTTLREAAERLEPFSGIGLANGATRSEVAKWLRNWADEIDPLGADE